MTELTRKAERVLKQLRDLDGPTQHERASGDAAVRRMLHAHGIRSFLVLQPSAAPDRSVPRALAPRAGKTVHVLWSLGAAVVVTLGLFAGQSVRSPEHTRAPLPQSPGAENSATPQANHSVSTPTATREAPEEERVPARAEARNLAADSVSPAIRHTKPRAFEGRSASDTTRRANARGSERPTRTRMDATVSARPARRANASTAAAAERAAPASSTAPAWTDPNAATASASSATAAAADHAAAAPLSDTDTTTVTSSAARAVDAAAKSSLSEELKFLASVDAQLRAGAYSRALQRLGQHKGSPVLAEERAALRVLALCGRDNDAQAARARDHFLAGAPSSVLAARVRAACPGEPQP